jgi:hypothetical protein
VTRFFDYTTDELIAMRDWIGDPHLIDCEVRVRGMIRRAWLDHCNEVACEVIA